MELSNIGALTNRLLGHIEQIVNIFNIFVYSLAHQQPNVIIIGGRKHRVDPRDSRLRVNDRREGRFLLLLRQ